MKGIYRSINKRIARFVAKYIDIEEQSDDLRYQDPITRLPKRKILIDAFNARMKLSERKEIAIFVINIDRLHSINELYGRDIGDEVIIKLGNRLKELFKENNTVYREDHFYLSLDDVSVESLEGTGEKVLSVLSEPFEIDGRSFRMTVSVGISHYPSTGGNIGVLLQQAEIAMSKVKSDGKNNYALILPEDITEIERKRKLEFDLKGILDREELYLTYQPEVYLETGEIRAAEALVRWEHPDLGNISPVEFIPVAEETGMINEIGKWVIHNAVSHAKEWHDDGLKICLAVNISYVQFKDQAFVRNILDILDSVGFDSNYLIIEITESLMKDLDRVDLVTQELKEHKIRIAIDDFGTGYSSLSVLGSMYVDMIKIDRTFVKNLPADKKSVQMVNTMIQIGENLESTIVAEGVETVEQLDFLLRNGCEFAQGYYFSRPVSSEGILSYAKKLQRL